MAVILSRSITPPSQPNPGLLQDGESLQSAGYPGFAAPGHGRGNRVLDEERRAIPQALARILNGREMNWF